MLVRRNSGVFAAMRFGGGAEPSFMFEPVACGRRDARRRAIHVSARAAALTSPPAIVPATVPIG